MTRHASVANWFEAQHSITFAHPNWLNSISAFLMLLSHWLSILPNRIRKFLVSIQLDPTLFLVHGICSINAGFGGSYLHPLTRLSYYTILPILRTSRLPSKMSVSQCTLPELLVLIIMAGSPIIIMVAVCQSRKRGLINMSKASPYPEHDTNPFSTRLTFTNILDNVHAVSHSLALTPLGFAPQKTGIS